MAAPLDQNQVQTDHKPSDKELNFRALEAKYQRQLEAERQARLELERKVQESQRQPEYEEEEEDTDEPYVDVKKLNKRLAKFGEKTKQQTQSEVQQAVRQAIAEERKANWLRNNPDFEDVLMQHAEKLMLKDPELAETILEMPQGFERQKLVYKNIKALGLDKPEVKQQTIQDKIDANRKSPYYQPSGIAAAPYAATGDFSPVGQKNAYAKMQELKSKLRL